MPRLEEGDPEAGDRLLSLLGFQLEDKAISLPSTSPSPAKSALRFFKNLFVCTRFYGEAAMSFKKKKKRGKNARAFTVALAPISGGISSCDTATAEIIEK